MSYAAATYSDVTPFDGRIVVPAVPFQLFGRLAVGLGTLAVAGGIAAAATLAAISMIGTAVSSHSHWHAKASVGLATIGMPNQGLLLAGTADFSDTLRLTDRVTAFDRAASIEVAHATIPPAPVATPLPPKRPVQTAANVPLPRPAPPASHAAAPAPTDTADLTQFAALVPAAGLLQPDTAPAPAKRVLADTNKTPAPPRRPPAAAHIEAKDERAPAPAKSAAPQLATVVPPPSRATPGPSDKPFGDADSRTAIYDIEAHTVYMPDGERLEAHSGLGHRIDDPRYVGQKDRGPTPPNVYDLSLREDLFHGVRAIRLNPANEDKMFGRDGMLAHTYMLGSSGQSFGCVSFKNYQAFLRAYLNGDVDRLVVVAHLAHPPQRIARRAPTSRYAFAEE